jgi:hypothetical protein
MATDKPFNLPIATTPTKAGLADLLNLLKREIALEMNCHHLGTVQTFDEDTQTASVTINYQRTVFQTDPTTRTTRAVLFDYPVLQDVPVQFLFGGAGGLTVPVLKGDPCLVLFNDRDMDNWFEGALTGPVATPRTHHLSDGLVVVGFRNRQIPIENFNPDRPNLRNFSGDTGVDVGESKVRVYNPDHTLNEVLQELVNDVKTLGNHVAALTATCPSGGGPLIINPPWVADITNDVAALAATAAKIEDLLE